MSLAPSLQLITTATSWVWLLARLLLKDQAAFDDGRTVVVRGLGEQHIFELGPDGQRNLTLVR